MPIVLARKDLIVTAMAFVQLVQPTPIVELPMAEKRLVKPFAIPEPEYANLLV